MAPQAHKACGWERFLSSCSEDFTHPSAECKSATGAALKYVPSPLDPYDVLAKTCQSDANKVDKDRDAPPARALVVQVSGCVAPMTLVLTKRANCAGGRVCLSVHATPRSDA